MTSTIAGQPSLMARIDAASRTLPPSEASVAAAVMGAPAETVGMSIAALAEKVGVSEPTVARFSKSLGYSGFRAFKLALTYAIAQQEGVPFVHGDVNAHDRTGDILSKIINRSISTLSVIRDSIDPASIDRAVVAMAGARRVDFYGQGNSGIVAQDAEHKFFRLGIATSSSSDPHVHSMAAALLGADDVVVAISAGGRTQDIIHSASIAREAGATVIGMTVDGSPLARQCDIVIATELFEDQDYYSPMTSRLSHLVLIDVLAVGVAIRLGQRVIGNLEKAKAAVRQKRAAAYRGTRRAGLADE